MIEIKNLSKIYTSKRGVNCTALNDVSFKLPETGMIFIIGKSGSGKSTLLNMIGGLDKVTSGEIIANGNKFSEFKESDYVNYRNNFVGYIFQDYCLFEKLTVKDNIKFALDLQNKPYDEHVEKILCDLDIKEDGNRLVRELSGGQKQRVGIARALVKNPKLILADEPTGNLDSLIAKYVLDTLKSLSQNNLVLIVSHNQNDAYKYADRILELADGKIISDVEKQTEVKDKLTIIDDKITLPNSKLKNEDIEKINSVTKEKPTTFSLAPEKFVESKEIKESSNAIKISKSNFNKKKIFSYSFKMFSDHKIAAALSAIFISFLLIVFGLSQSMVNFDENRAIDKAFNSNKMDTFILQKGFVYENSFDNSISTDVLTPINEDDIQKFKDAGIDSGIYPLYNVTLEYGDNYNIEYDRPLNDETYSQFFAKEAKGVLLCDEDYLTKLYGNDGKLDIIYNENISPIGIYITDYIADSIMFYNPQDVKNYNRVINGFFKSRKINGIINTRYKERYQDVFDKLMKLLQSKNIKKFKELLHEERTIQLMSEIKTTLNIAYTFNPNFANDLIKDDSNRFAHVRNSVISNGENCIYGRYLIRPDFRLGDCHINDDEVFLNVEMFNKLFGTSFKDADLATESLTGNEFITFSEYPFNTDTNKTNPYYTIKLKVKKIVNQNSLYVSKNVLKIINKYYINPYTLYFSNAQVSKIYEIGKSLNYEPESSFFNLVSMVASVSNATKELFSLITTLICTICVLYLMFYSVSLVKKKTYQIGVMRALGGKNNDIVAMFLIQSFILLLVICIMSSVGLIISINVANSSITENYAKIFDMSRISQMEIVQFNPIILAIDLVSACLIMIASLIIPIILIRRIKPMKIIRAKE